MAEARGSFHSYVDRFSVFDSVVTLAGWVFCSGRNVERIELLIGREPAVDVPRGFPSDDVAAVFGDAAARCRFSLRAISGAPYEQILAASLRVTFSDGGELVLRELGERNKGEEPVHRMFLDFLATLAEGAPGRFLEIGSRARSGVERKGLIPATWQYAGFDVVAGPNVDVVGDAHHLSKFFACGSFDGVMALSVLEHLLMPWKFAIELNRVMRVGAVAYFLTHQTYGLHDVPWDFWRFSSDAWPALFNDRSGFEIVRAALGEPAFVVPQLSRSSYNPYAPAYLASAVIVRKISETSLVWDVDVESLIATTYPGASATD
jgi:hypothetical protein